MRRSTSSVDRLVTAAIAIALLVAGIFTILWRLDVAIADKAIAHASPRWYALAPQQSWWDWTLGGIAIAAFVLGLWLLIANLRRSRLGAVELDGTGANGTLTCNVGQVGNAVAAMLERHPVVHSASARSELDRGRRTVRITIVTGPEASIPLVRRLAAETAADIGTALTGADVTTQVFVRIAGT